METETCAAVVRTLCAGGPEPIFRNDWAAAVLPSEGYSSSNVSAAELMQ